jgi:hypothetical protein
MRARFLLLLLLFPVIATAQPRKTRSAAEGCLATLLSCNTHANGQLAPGDCEENGYYDIYGFTGTAGTMVEVSMRSLDPNLADVYLELIPPTGDASKTPVMIGARAATVRYRLASSGTWAILAGAADISGSGKYRLDLRCFSSTSPAPQNCVTQQMVCRQTLLWDLTPSSCRFTASTKPYAIAEIIGQAGDVLRVEADTIGFQPIVALDDARNNRITQSFNPSFRHAQFDAFLPSTSLYTMLITNVNDTETGSFQLTATCTTSGCAIPLFIREPQDVKVPFGSSVTVTAEVNAIGTTTYEWSDVTDFPSGVGSTTAPSLTIGPVRSRRVYAIVATNACGTTVSRQFVVEPEPTKRRAVGRR